MMNPLDVNIVGTAARIILLVLAVGLGIALVARRRPWWPLVVVVAALVGWLAGIGGLVLLEGPLEVVPTVQASARPWVWAGCGGMALVLANLWRSSWQRRLSMLPAAAAVVLVAALGVNAAYGLNPTLRTLMGGQITPTIELPLQPPKDTPSAVADGPLWRTWQPPQNLPAKGRRGSVTIPAPSSGFKARTAEIYLPPAALVDNAPALPVVVMMMGSPGRPDVSWTADVMDSIAAKNRGLAPIVVVADQNGSESGDSLCLDTKELGRAQSYINVDVVGWIQENLRVSTDRRQWTVAGYSNGGQCAASFVAKYPQIWGNMFAMASEEYPGAEHPDKTLRDIYKGNQKAYDADKPAVLYAARPFADTTGIFAVAADDAQIFRDATSRLSAAAKRAKMDATQITVPSGGHGAQLLVNGLPLVYRQLYPRWGLSEPGKPVG